MGCVCGSRLSIYKSTEIFYNGVLVIAGHVTSYEEYVTFKFWKNGLLSYFENIWDPKFLKRNLINKSNRRLTMY
jgi:hypothetical protein